MSMNLATFVSDVAAAANGHWPEVLLNLGIDVPRGGKHGPCPLCGGKDRFRFDDKGGRGTWICNNCGADDGLTLVSRTFNTTMREAATQVAGALGLYHVAIYQTDPAHLRQQQQARIEAEQQQKQLQRQKAARRAADILRDCKLGQSPYLAHKQLDYPVGLLNCNLIRAGGEAFPPGSLVVPLYNEAGELVNVQLIDEQSRKVYLAGGQMAGAWHRIPGSALVAVCEGYATGLSIHQATGATVYCAMNAGNLLAVARLVRGVDDPSQPCRVILCADNDANTEGNPGKTKAEQAAAAIGARVALPPEAGDWNDYHQTHGLNDTKRAIMSQIEANTAQEASQKEGPSAEVIPLHPEPKPDNRQADQVERNKAYEPSGMLEKMAASQLANLLIERLGQLAINTEAERVYRYDGSLWEPIPDILLRREMVAILTEDRTDFSDRKPASAVATMKLMIPVLGSTRDDLIGFANGVYDMTAREFRPHSPADGLLNHNGITYSDPWPDESIEQHAPHFTRWLSHAADRDRPKMERIKAALFMVLANRYDWQLFLEVTGEGGSGKSTMANLCELLVGSRNVGSSSMKRLESDFGLESVWDKRLILLPDQPQYIGDGAILKAITGGDEVSVNQKGKAMFSTKVRAVVLATNNTPMVMTERNGGMGRRRVIFAFNNVVADVDKDPLLGEKIAAELPVIIRHLLTRFAEPENAKALLLEQRNSADAIAVKRRADPLFDLCAMLVFGDEPNGLRVGGNTSIKREPKRYFYHLYLDYLEYHGHKHALPVNVASRAVKQYAEELGFKYKTRRSNGIVTNILLTEEVAEFMPRAVSLDLDP